MYTQTQILYTYMFVAALVVAAAAGRSRRRAATRNSIAVSVVHVLPCPKLLGRPRSATNASKGSKGREVEEKRING